MRAARRRGKLRSVVAWLFFLLQLLVLAMSSQGHHELLVRAEEQPSPVGTSMRRGWEEQRLSSVGSRPPCCACRRRCGGCAPCKAVQVRAGVGIARPLCADYEPVRWKCKCGDAVFDP